ncbi:MAG: hypothetical protein HQ515_21115, partial [Phycisphaeraceae bacterium]|nr:hypothetical protein [Phycisphaeraceae bacterium]
MRCLSWVLVLVVTTGMLIGCRSRDKFKTEADEEVYEILNSKWQDQYGEIGNYQISDPNINSEDALPESRELALSEAVGMAVSYSREYQTTKESLYSTALGLTDTRHQYARQWFGTIDADYALGNGSDEITAGAGAGV